MLNRGLRFATVLLLILGQCFAELHEAEAGDEDHSDHCVICLATPSDEEQDAIPPSPVDSPIANSSAKTQRTLLLPAAVTFVRAAWPPQTGPPSRV